MWIYKIINNKNKKVLIGQTIQRPGRRWMAHKSELNRQVHKNPHFQSAWNKYGEDSFLFEVINQANSIDELNILEILEIKNHNSLNSKFGYNKLSGGNNSIPNDMVREKHKIRMIKLYESGWIHPMLGRTHTELTKQKMKDHWKEYFETHSGMTVGRPLTQEHKDKLSNSWSRKYPPIQSPDSKIFNITNIHKFSRDLGFNKTERRSIARVFSGEKKSYKGWKLVNSL